MTTVATPDVLAKVPLFAGCDRKTLEQLGKLLKDRTFRAGTHAVEEGQPGAGFFIVLDGIATIDIGGHEVRKIGAGDWFGEIALLVQDSVRTATVIADTDLKCIGLTAWEFRPFLAEHPDVAWQVMGTMARRIADHPGTS